MLTLRPYQSAALEKIMADLRKQPNVLLQAAVGAGKTVMFSALIQRLLTDYGAARVVVLAHREELVQQAVDKLIAVWPEAVDKISIACASISSRVDYDKPILIGSVQTLARRMSEMREVHLVIIDEVHRLPPRAKGSKISQYQRYLDGVRQIYPSARLLGVTATPYRLGAGYIYGDKCREPEANWFEDLSYEIGIRELQKESYLSPLVPLGIMAPDLDSIKISSGEYVLSQLGDEMSKDIYIRAAVDAWKEHASDRRSTVAFCVTIEHAEMLRGAFEGAGIPCECVHSEMPRSRRREILNAFQKGDLPVVCNVGVLTEGWDAPATDCVMLCRPTQSTALYVQMVGRGLRLAPGKTDCLLLDLAGCWKMHGDVRHPRVRWGKAREQNDMVECPKCKAMNDAGRLVCWECGAELHPGKDPNLCPFCHYEVSYRAIRCPVCGRLLKTVAHETPTLSRLDADETPRHGVLARIERTDPNFGFVSKKGNAMLRLGLTCTPLDPPNALPVSVNEFLDFDGNGSLWAQEKARRWWFGRTKNTPPHDLVEAEERWDEVELPEVVTLGYQDSWWKVERWGA